MTTFAVFGMTRAAALSDARKKTEPTKFVSGKPVSMTLDEFEEVCQRKAEKVMKSAKRKQLSQLFDAPQFAEQFIRMTRAAGDCRDLHIRYRSTLKDAQGNPIINKKTGMNKVGWTDYKVAA